MTKVGRDVDWDAAERHGEANLVLMNCLTDITKEGEFCLCCNKKYPGDEHKYPLCGTKNEELWTLGEGFPLFFEFIKYLLKLMLFLTVFYFIPAAILI